MNEKRSLLPLLAGAIIVIIALIVLLPRLFNVKNVNIEDGNGNNETAMQQQESSEDVEIAPNQANFETSSTEWHSNQSHEVALTFDSLPDPAPAAFTIQLLYDPEIVQIDDVEPGNLWGGVNVLQKDIDNTNGELMYSAGQGFETEVTGNTTLATIKITVKTLSSGEVDTLFQLGPESATASVGINKLIKLEAPPLKINLVK